MKATKTKTIGIELTKDEVAQAVMGFARRHNRIPGGATFDVDFEIDEQGVEIVGATVTFTAQPEKQEMKTPASASV